MTVVIFSLCACVVLAIGSVFAWRAFKDTAAETAGHDFTTIDEDELSGAIEGNLRMVLPHYVHVELNRSHNKEAA